MARSKHSVGVVIAGGGLGRRMKHTRPKQFLVLDGKPILVRTTELFDRHPSITEIVVVAPAEYVHRAETLLRVARVRKLSHVVVGGTERQDSVRNGLLSFSQQPEIVLVHDAVRPFVDPAVVRRVIETARRYGAAVAGIALKDTLKIGKGRLVVRTLDRTKVWAVQTPQGFRYDLLVKAHHAAERAGFIGTDDASLLERLGIPVALVEGSAYNIKITTKDDLKLARLFLNLWR